MMKETAGQDFLLTTIIYFDITYSFSNPAEYHYFL